MRGTFIALRVETIGKSLPDQQIGYLRILESYAVVVSDLKVENITNHHLAPGSNLAMDKWWVCGSTPSNARKYRLIRCAGFSGWRLAPMRSAGTFQRIEERFERIPDGYALGAPVNLSHQPLSVGR